MSTERTPRGACLGAAKRQEISLPGHYGRKTSRLMMAHRRERSRPPSVWTEKLNPSGLWVV